MTDRMAMKGTGIEVRLRKALISLYEEANLANITVSDLCLS